MKLTLFLFTFFGVFHLGFSQEKSLGSKATGAYKVYGFNFSEIKDEKEIKSTYYKKIKTLIFDSFDKQDFKFINEKLKKKDSTYSFGITYWVNNKGMVIDGLIGSTIRQNNPSLHQKTKIILNSWIINKKDNKLVKTLLNKQHFLTIKVKKYPKNNYKLIKSDKKRGGIKVSDSIIPPYYKNCNLVANYDYTEKALKERKKCLEKNIRNFVLENFNKDKLKKPNSILTKRYGLLGRKIKTYVHFGFDKNGDVTPTGALGLLPSLEREFLLMAATKFPKPEPGLKNGEPVQINYSLPITFITPKNN